MATLATRKACHEKIDLQNTDSWLWFVFIDSYLSMMSMIYYNFTCAALSILILAVCHNSGPTNTGVLRSKIRRTKLENRRRTQRFPIRTPRHRKWSHAINIASWPLHFSPHPHGLTPVHQGRDPTKQTTTTEGLSRTLTSQEDDQGRVLPSGVRVENIYAVA